MALTTKQSLFLDHYLGDAHGNATEAARRAGYQGSASTLAHIGHDNLGSPEIADASRRRSKRRDDRRGVPGALAVIARLDPAGFR